MQCEASVVCLSVRPSVNICANRFFLQANGRIATKLAHDGLRVSLHPGCAQGQGQRSRETRTFLDSWNELLRHWRSGSVVVYFVYISSFCFWFKCSSLVQTTHFISFWVLLLWSHFSDMVDCRVFCSFNPTECSVQKSKPPGFCHNLLIFTSYVTDTLSIIIIRNICSAPFTDKTRTAVHYIVSKNGS